MLIADIVQDEYSRDWVRAKCDVCGKESFMPLDIRSAKFGIDSKEALKGELDCDVCKSGYYKVFVGYIGNSGFRRLFKDKDEAQSWISKQENSVMFYMEDL